MSTLFSKATTYREQLSGIEESHLLQSPYNVFVVTETEVVRNNIIAISDWRPNLSRELQRDND